MTPQETAFFAALHPDGWRDMRAIAKDKSTEAFSFPADDLPKIEEFSSRFPDRNIYFGVATRLHANGRGEKECGLLTALWVDIDFKDVPEAEARTALEQFPVPPSALVHSGFGLHAYWFLREAINLQMAENRAHSRAVLRALAKTLRGDLVSAEPARILRVPGTLNLKYNPPRPVVLEYLSTDDTCSLADLLPHIGPLSTVPVEVEAEPIQHGVSLEERRARARAWLVKQHPAIEGQGGDNHTFKICCTVAIGYDLSEKEAFQLLKDHWNQRCQPPWTEKDLRTKLRNAIEHGGGPRGSQLKTQPARSLTLTSATEIAVKPVHWLWDLWIPAGSLSLLAGREGIGKSLVTMTLAADISKGRLPGQFFGIPRSVIIAATEDSWSCIIKPRLIAAGADLARIFRVDVTTSAVGTSELVLPTDVAELKRLILERGDVGLIILDPLLSRLARKLDSHKDAEVRVGLEPTVQLADETGVSLIGIIHVNKSGSTDPLNAIMGSRAFPAVSRAVLFCAVDPNDDKSRLLGNPKSNFGPNNLPTKVFTIKQVFVADTPEGKVYATKLVWSGESQMSIRDALQDASSNEKNTKVADAKRLLVRMLTARQILSTAVDQAAEEMGISEKTLDRAKKELGVRSVKVGNVWCCTLQKANEEQADLPE